MFGVGCRALRCGNSTDAGLAAARRMSLQAIDAQERGQWEQAEALFAAAVEQCPADERAHHGYAEALWQRGAQDQAVAHMEEAVRLSGSDPQRLVQLGGMYLHRGEPRRAGEQADRAIAANGQLAGAWALRGRVQQSLDDREAALASYHRALGLEPHYPDVQLAIAEIYARLNRPQRALATLQSLADRYQPGEVPGEILVREGLACRALGRHHDAARKLAEATTRGNGSAELYFELAQAHLQAGDPAAARVAVEAALARQPGHPGCLALAQKLGPQESSVVAAAASTPARPLH